MSRRTTSREGNCFTQHYVLVHTGIASFIFLFFLFFRETKVKKKNEAIVARIPRTTWSGSRIKQKRENLNTYMPGGSNAAAVHQAVLSDLEAELAPLEQVFLRLENASCIISKNGAPSNLLMI